MRVNKTKKFVGRLRVVGIHDRTELGTRWQEERYGTAWEILVYKCRLKDLGLLQELKRWGDKDIDLFAKDRYVFFINWVNKIYVVSKIEENPYPIYVQSKCGGVGFYI